MQAQSFRVVARYDGSGLGGGAAQQGIPHVARARTARLYLRDSLAAAHARGTVGMDPLLRVRLCGHRDRFRVRSAAPVLHSAAATTCQRRHHTHPCTCTHRCTHTAARCTPLHAQCLRLLATARSYIKNSEYFTDYAHPPVRARVLLCVRVRAHRLPTRRTLERFTDSAPPSVGAPAHTPMPTAHAHTLVPMCGGISRDVLRCGRSPRRRPRGTAPTSSSARLTA